jgi:hypothetical protein
MWPPFLHHITLHFPIVLALVLAAVGLWSLRDDTPQFRRFMRFGGWICFGFATVTAVSGILAAPGWFGGEGSQALSHHRNLGVTAWVVMAIAALSYEWGIRSGIEDWRKFAVGVWCVASFAVIGAGHWGGTERHPDELPWNAEDTNAQPSESIDS